MTRIRIVGDDAKIVEDFHHGDLNPDELPDHLSQPIAVGMSRDSTSEWGEYDSEAEWVFAHIVSEAKRYIGMINNDQGSFLAGLTENLAADLIMVNNEYPIDLIDVGDNMAEFTLIEARFVILSNVNGEQRFEGDYAVVEQFFRTGKAYLRGQDMSWLEAVQFCADDIERRNSVGA